MIDFSSIKCVSLKHMSNEIPIDFQFGLGAANEARNFHQTFHGYEPTPLVNLQRLANQLGVAAIYVKDESRRFNLNAFKVLGGSYAVARIIASKLGMSTDEMTFENLTSDETRAKLGRITLVTATDGNHGRGVAWTANRLGQRCVVFMPQGSARERLENIRALGAEASITDMNYDDTVRHAADYANKTGGILVQDTSKPGYEEIPAMIMQGYLTMADEAAEQLDGVAPTHIFLQAGVGSMAGAVTGYFAAKYGDMRPKITIVEPNAADCNYRTALADDGELHSVGGSLNTIMAGLACGEPCAVSWRVLRAYADSFISMPDDVSAIGMRVLGAPIAGDERIISGESGAAGFGIAFSALYYNELESLKKELGLNANSRILCFSTEGATDSENYRRITWGA